MNRYLPLLKKVAIQGSGASTLIKKLDAQKAQPLTIDEKTFIRSIIMGEVDRLLAEVKFVISIGKEPVSAMRDLTKIASDLKD